METNRALDGLLGAGTEVTGTLRFEEAVRIDGKFKGKIESKSTLVLGTTAEVDAEIRVGQLEIHGKLRGKVEGAQKVVIHASGVVESDLSTERVAIEKGAIFRGRCEMPAREEKFSKPQRAASAILAHPAVPKPSESP